MFCPTDTCWNSLQFAFSIGIISNQGYHGDEAEDAFSEIDPAVAFSSLSTIIAKL